jgi:hypothetical protein
MRIVYIAGPFRGPTAWDIERNVRAAEELAFEVFQLGAMPMIPHANTRFFHGQGPDLFWLEGTLELLRRCDAMILTPDWRRSTGASVERLEALKRGIHVFEHVGDLASWLAKPSPRRPFDVGPGRPEE